MSDYAIQTTHLTRYFGAKRVVYDLNLSVPRGSIFGFLGRNGSGKTTTLRMLLGLLAPSWGESTILDHDSQNLPPQVRARIGYLAEGHPVHGWMRVSEAHAYQSKFYPNWNRGLFHAVLEFFRVDPKTRARNLSRGERAGLCLAMALAPEPDLLILDDPAIGLDPVARRSLLESMVYATRKADRTIIFSSHLLADIERMADHIAILDYSILRAQCSLETFRSCVQQFVLKFDSTPPELPRIRGIIQCIPRERHVRLTLVNVTQETRTILHSLGAVSVDEVPISLEDAFVSYLGGNLETVRLPEMPQASARRRCVMMTVFLKELRENLKWAGVICGLLIIIVIKQIRAPAPMLLFDFSKGCLVFYGALAGLVMGVMQTVFETKPDNWAFVVHRPVARLRIFIAKCAAGLLLVYVALVLPCLLMTAWVARPGTVAIPFQWRMLGPLTIDVLNAGCFYFAGIVVTLRRARWYGSRVLPVCTAIACSMITFGFVNEVWQAALLSLGVQAICAIAAWGVFASHGVMDRSPIQRAALGAMLYPGGFGICVTIAGLSQLFTSNQQWSYYRMDRDGQIVLVTQTIGYNDRSWAFADPQGKPIAKYENVDLDDPAYAETFIRFGSFIADERSVPWPLDVIYSSLGYRSANPGVINLRTIAPPNAKLNFSVLYDVHDRVIKLYDPVSHTQIGTVSPAGFAARGDLPADRFPPGLLNVSQQSGRHVMPFVSTVYWIEMKQRRVLPIFQTDADDPIFSAAEIGPVADPIALVATRHQIHALKPDGTKLFSAPLPIDQATMYFNSALLPENRHVVLWAGFMPGFGDRTWFMEFDADGKLLNRIEPPLLPSPSHKRMETAMFAGAVPAAALPFFPRWLFDELVDIRTREFSKLFNGYLAGFAALSAVVTLLIARRCRFNWRRTLGWTVANLLLGPPGVITMLSVTDWPAREPCTVFGKQRFAGRRDCVDCGAPLPRPELDGREIFEPIDTFQPAM